MWDNKMSLTAIHVCKINFFVILLLAIFVVFTVAAANSSLFAAGSVKGHGVLTSIEDDGSVIIDGKGYLVSPSVIVQDYRGDDISLRSLLPSRYVSFEYEYAARGFIIISIKEIPQ